MNAEQALQECYVQGLVIKLPAVQLERDVYFQLKNKLEVIGGKWKGGKVAGFEFGFNPSAYLTLLKSGKSFSFKKDYHFFPTPPDLADEMVNMACIHNNEITLEPSAGQGAIVESILEMMPSAKIDCCELLDVNKAILEMKGYNVVCDDFMQLDRPEYYDNVIANPPFMHEIDHIRKMVEVCKPGGRIITLSSPGVFFRSSKLDKAFQQWMEELDAYVQDVKPGRFKSSGTNIGAKLIQIDRPQVVPRWPLAPIEKPVAAAKPKTVFQLALF